MFFIIFLSCTGIFLVSAVLQIISYSKKLKVLEYVAKPMMYTFLIAAAVFALIPSLPDSRNILICTCISLGLGMLASCLLFAPKKKRFLIASMLSFIISSVGWLDLIWPSFHLFSLNFYLSLGLVIVYLAGFALYINFVIGRKNLIKVSGIFVYLLPILIFNYATILTVFGHTKLYSFILLAGSTSLLISQGFIVKGFFKKVSSSERFVRTILFVFSQFCITAGFVTMVTV